ncbi:hypothetical protein KAFR_0K01350 [Kazachstania africana CBS 2517]|uniref:CCZ1/INTU/HSP4 first Longin domain-containing protein n=1 Tax=Kazachstania africana (strain ATCC 22294 / BCRC 22015 / CBS 2517 / CECT 1963 / NBRC 1671 / NRRL Y-8276) TaxID=1071382 RepID=H2B1I9_KAZAF|nr:hypothetical protein KAFR_0K01350 [Kazachstania africana CBS 2517]CCF60489.1 hypothetical protein KAFR_0K01350 [Kazachstania africana CBS 2517]
MLQFLTVVDPTRSHSEDDAFETLVLYHEFDTKKISSLNDKLSQIGIIQGIWSFTGSLSDGSQDYDRERVIELEAETMVTIQVESRFLITVSVNKDNVGIPYQYYMSQLWFCYKFFILEYGQFSNFQDIKELTNLLNEQLIPFWSDIHLKPDTIIRRGIESLWPNSYKIADLDFKYRTSTNSDDLETWESIIKQNILFQEENYLGLKDILVYHLPTKKKRKFGTKSYGLVQHFCANFENIADLSNWVYNLQSKYDDLSSHVIAGNAHYKEVPTNLMENEQQNQEIGQDGDTVADNHQPLTERVNSGSKLMHNLTLPVSMAYEALQEVGTTTGISNSMSFFEDYIPFWSFNIFSGKKNTSLRRNENNRYGFLISPLSSDILPQNYRTKKLHLTFDGKTDIYNSLFWYYDDLLILIICEKTFDRIWDHNYLKNIGYILRSSMEKLCANAFSFSIDEDQEWLKSNNTKNFAYTVIDKNSKILRSSITPCYELSLDSDNKSPLELVVEGVDELLTKNGLSVTERHWGLDIMGDFLRFGYKTEPEPQSNMDESKLAYKKYTNFLDSMNNDKLRELHEEVLQFLTSMQNSRRTKEASEERLITLGNGLLCYLKENEQQLVVILKNWFFQDSAERSNNDREDSLFSSLGKDVIDWWESAQ